MIYETETLRFMDTEIVPFTNNREENDLRMTKVKSRLDPLFHNSNFNMSSLTLFPIFLIVIGNLSWIKVNRLEDIR